MTYIERAHAKINLFLDVGAPRADGFHDVVTVMHSVSLYDEISLDVSNSKKNELYISVEGAPEIPSEKNLATRAACAFFSAIGESARVNIKIEKRIPVAAGLAGGSSDAAATLRALNLAFGARLTEGELLRVAASLGSDVPYCLVGGTVLCRGRGELLAERYNPAPHYFVIAVSDECVSTPAAYAQLDRIYNSFDGSVPKNSSGALDSLIASFRAAKLPSALYNIFEEAILPGAPKARQIKDELLGLGARLALMSGSGPSVFGIFDTEREAEAAAARLTSGGVRAFCVHSV